MFQPDSRMNPIRILIADDHHLVADSLNLLLSTEASFEVVATVSNGQQALNFLIENEVDILLSDYHMPILNGVELVMKLKEHHIEVKTIMLTMNEEASFIKESIQVGVYGYVMKSAEKEELVRVIKKVAAGEKYFGENTIKKLAEIELEPSQRMTLADIQSLTKRELEIIRLVLEDLGNAEIGYRLGISTATVETHRRNLMKKIGVNSSIGLMRWGLKNGLVDKN